MLGVGGELVVVRVGGCGVVGDRNGGLRDCHNEVN